MTDLAHTGSVARAGPPGVIEPIRRSGSRKAALARQPGLAESAADDQLRAADVALYMAKRVAAIASAARDGRSPASAASPDA